MTEAVWVAQTTLGGLLVFAGLVKLRDLAAFEKGVAGHGVVPPRLVPAVSRMVPITEVVLGVLIWPGAASPMVLVATLALLLAFTAVTVVTVVHGRPVPCNCMGAHDEDRVGAGTLLRLALMMLAAAVVLTPPRVDTFATFRSVSAADGLSLLGLWGAATGALLLIAPLAYLLGGRPVVGSESDTLPQGGTQAPASRAQ